MDLLGTSPHTIDFTDQIYRVEFSPYEYSQNLICIALANKIAVGNVKFQVCMCVYSHFIVFFSTDVQSTRSTPIQNIH
jgi:hypothetical protein